MAHSSNAAVLERLPERNNLAAVVPTIARPYRQVFSAALFDTDYLADADTSVARPYDEAFHDANNVLTEATRLTNQPMRQHSLGQWEAEADPEPSQHCRSTG